MKHISKLAILLSVAAVLYLLCAVAMLTPMQSLGLYGGMALSLLLTAALFYITLHLQKVTHVNDSAKTDDDKKAENNDKKDEVNKDVECKDDKQNTPETVEKVQENSQPTASLDSKEAASNASDEASKSEQNQDASDKT